MKRPSGRALLVLIALLVVGEQLSRSLPAPGEGPAFVLGGPSRSGPILELGAGFREPGIHQFIDVSATEGVISLTIDLQAADALREALSCSAPRSGEKFEFISQPPQKSRLERSWMPAAERIALGIPLDPDLMAAADWEDLPGAGPILAQKIMADRQINGEFVSIDRLCRVRGVGEKRVRGWKKFF